VPRLVYNSMLSWAGGWYFLIASEIIAVGRRSWVLPGLGSYIGESITLGRQGLAAAGLVSLVAVIVLLNLLVWSPLESWSERFRYETRAGETTGAAIGPTPATAAPLVRGGLVRVGRRVGSLLGRVAALASQALSHAWIRPLLALVAVAGLLALGYGAVQTVQVLLRPLGRLRAQVPPPEAERQVDTAVNWGRWADLFDYDADDACFLQAGAAGRS
jgi:NitT/TauT family transport system permease protein